MNEQQDFLKILTERLDAAGIPYMLTGSIALSVYTTPRMTRDIDLVVECQQDRVDDWLRLFSSDCYLSEEAVSEALNQRGMFNIIHNESITKADIIVMPDEEYRILEFSRRKKMLLVGHEVMVVAPEDLLLSKLVWWKESDSPQQRADLELLLNSIPELDWEYILPWAKKLDVHLQLEQLRP